MITQRITNKALNRLASVMKPRGGKVTDWYLDLTESGRLWLTVNFLTRDGDTGQKTMQL